VTNVAHWGSAWQAASSSAQAPAKAQPMHPDDSQKMQSGEGEEAKPQSPEPSQKPVVVPDDTDEVTLVVGPEDELEELDGELEELDDEMLAVGAPPAPPDPSWSSKTMPPQEATRGKIARSHDPRKG